MNRKVVVVMESEVVAFLKDKPEKRGTGRNRKEAQGDLMSLHPEEFGLVIEIGMDPKTLENMTTLGGQK